jgi:hypothetical protein
MVHTGRLGEATFFKNRAISIILKRTLTKKSDSSGVVI